MGRKETEENDERKQLESQIGPYPSIPSRESRN
jgi:hypothetical protein